MIYTPLHCHSDASSDGAGTVDALVKRAAEIGLSSMALTDHGTLANSVAFWSACKEHGVKPIMGQEIYLSYKGNRHHLTLLCLNEEGFNELIKVSSHAYEHRFSGGYPLITLDDLSETKNIFALTGCASSAIHQGEKEDGIAFVGDLFDSLGRHMVGAEVMFVGTHDVWNRPLEIAKRFGLDVYVTNDTHYPCERQFPAHQAITQARKGFTYDSKHLWLKSAEEIMHEGCKWMDRLEVETGLFNTTIFSDTVQPWDMSAPPTLPHIDNVVETLSALLKDALKKDVALKGGTKLRIERLKYEFHILKEKGFLDYIYILNDIVHWAKNAGIAVGPGRGSGGGSYVLYLLGITQVDPIQYGTLFERFINPSRGDYPDVDVDFESDRRQEVMNYARDRWGTVAIATYSCYSHKSAVHDIARVLTIPKSLEEEAADSNFGSDAFNNFCAKHPDALATYNTMIGQIRHRGKHAAGVIIANRPVPIERVGGGGGELVAAWAEGMNTKDLSKVGVVKYDILGLTALSQLKLMERVSGASAPTDYDDPLVFDLFCDGEVTGIFQWTGSEGIRSLTMRIAPRNFSELAVINALYRPGALDAGTAEKYPEFMKNPRALHPRIDPHLMETYGVLCYQEQVMAVVAEVMGGDLSQADNVRKLLTKAAVGDPKWEGEVNLLYAAFIKEGLSQGFDGALLNELWSEVYTHSRYSFNKAHATAYTMISYKMAWYKVHHPHAFILAMLEYDKTNAQTYVIDAVQNDLAIEPPDINHSLDRYVYSTDTIYVPLSDIAFMGEKAVAYLIEERERNGPYLGYENFAKRIPKKVCNNRARTNLERIGAFRSFKDDPSTAIQNYEEVPIKGAFQTQLEVLSYVIPTKGLIAQIEYLRKQPVKKDHERFAGFIHKIVQKTSAKGPYSVYHLSPFGNFWLREERPRYKVGDFVAGTKGLFGTSENIKKYKLSS